ncbi:MAG: amylo-alpha-1,6-glucosidase [Thermomicrobiales bacterium]|nr:amylo-alpha-1,6-glucosidase [Thermomicrobiales bacterium]
MLDYDLVLKHNELYLVGEHRGDRQGERATGLYVRDTRFLDCWQLRLNDAPLALLEARVLGPDRAVVVGANELLAPNTAGIDEPVLPQTISVEQQVQLGVDLRVRIAVGNASGRHLPLTLSLELGADFRDMFDIRGFPHPRRDGSYLEPELLERNLRFGYTDRSGATTTLLVAFSQPPERVVDTAARALRGSVRTPQLPGLDIAVKAPRPPEPPHATARFPMTLAPGERWELLVTLTPMPVGGPPLSVTDAAERRGHDLEIARISTDNPDADRALDRAAGDLAMLETSFPDGRLIAAGIPWFVAPFGRDSLIVSLQTLHLAPGRAVETLRLLARLQGARVDPFREEEPGKILHEMRYGELARQGEIPHTPYYGSVDATPLFVMLFAETVRWTGDATFYRELLPNVERALAWIETWGDRDGDGLVEYATRVANGTHILHQGWKDSADSLNTPAGAPVFGDIALVEVQGYVYAAYRWLAEVAALHSDAAWAGRLAERAERVRSIVEERFWLPEEGFYAQALDSEKRPVAAIASNPGHLLYCGLPSPERARQVAERLRQPDLDSGWGVRTLASGMATYNPMSYHNGSVWPHDNSLIAAGLGRYGETEGLQRIASAIVTVAERLSDCRLPELYCGFPRDESIAADAPIRYPVSCSPQAWAAGALPLLIRALLGLDVDPQRQRVLVSPALPAWLDRVDIDGLQAFGRVCDLHVEREGDAYRIESAGPVEVTAAGHRFGATR